MDVEYNIRNNAIRWRISTSVKVIARIFTLALAVFEIWTFQMFDFESLGQGHRIQHSQLCHSMANGNLYESQHAFFFLALILSETSTFNKNVDIEITVTDYKIFNDVIGLQISTSIK